MTPERPSYGATVMNLDSLAVLFDRYLAWGRIPNYASLADAVDAFQSEQGEQAAREAREAIEWIQGAATDEPGVDSLDVVELVMEVENQYGFKIADEDAASLPELLESVRRLLDDEDGGSSVREPRLPRPPDPLTDAAVVEPPPGPSDTNAVLDGE
jgi:acyl carrier protein